MTTIILVAIGVLVAAAAALMIVFYGGAAFGAGETRAQAARLVGEGAQLSHAADLYYRQEERLPGEGAADPGAAAIVDLKEGQYIPVMPAGFVDASGARQDWRFDYSGAGMIYARLGTSTDESALSVCREARRQLGMTDKGSNGRLRVYKCDGSDYSADSGWAARKSLPDREPCCIRG